MIRIELLSDPLLAFDTASYLSNIAKRCGVPRHKAHALFFVLESILVLRMDDVSGDDPTIVVEARQVKDSYVVSVTDKGVPYALSENQKRLLRFGHIDKFTFEQLGEEGQRISVYSKMREDHAEPSVAEPKEEELLDSNFSCRLTTQSDQDIARAVQCIYTSYGYKYLHQDIYNYDHFRNSLRGGKYVSLLAENEHHQVAGHIAIEEHEWFPGVMELCNLVVKPIARGHNLGRILCHAVLEVGERRSLRGLYGMPVMFHPVSQRLLSARDFVPCGMYFHILPADASKQYGDGTSRLDVAICMRNSDKESLHTLYLPDECTAFTEGVFQKMEMSYELAEPRAGAGAGDQSVMSYVVDSESKLLEVKVDKVGGDLHERLANLPFQDELSSVEVVTVYLSMNDPGCPECYEALKGRGFIFTGCMPDSESHDYMMLQHLMGQPIVKENVVAEPDYVEMLHALFGDLW